jgi:hypothetical protein
MASLRYHAGRMVLYEAQPGWRVRIKTKTGKIDLPLSAIELEEAVTEAEQLYADARAIDNSHPYCQQCIHWKAVAARCDLGFPEGRASGGRFARDCSTFRSN